MLQVSGICKSYGKRRILDQAELSAHRGTCVGIVGAKGCGKTTLLSVLAGVRKPDRGSIRIDGQEASGHPAVFAAKAAYVPQENPLMEELTVRDNLLLWYKGSKGRMKEDLEHGPAALLGIPSMLERRAGKLSGGMKKRLSIACALSGQAPLLIMDEPGAALDLECKETIRQYLQSYLENGGTAVLTSHEMEELSMCSRLYVLRDGRLEEIPAGLGPKELIASFHPPKVGI